MSRHVILFLAANPLSTDPLRLGDECAAIQRELKMAPHRDDFQFESRWAVSIDEMIRHLNELAPTVIHFSGHGGAHGLLLQDEHGQQQLVSARALAMIVDAAATDVRLIVLNACYTAMQAEALRVRVDCVVGMAGEIGDAAARAFAMRFYGALGNRRSIGNAVDQAASALAARQLSDEMQPRCMTRDGVDKDHAFLHPRRDTAPVPDYPNTEVRALAERLEAARARRARLRDEGAATDDADREILALRRELRDGGQLRAGDTLADGRYLLIQEVGRGGFAVVWRAYDRHARRPVAIKVLHQHLATDRQRRDRFFRGARVMATLTHPAIVRVHEPKGQDDAFCYFVMELVTGGTLRDAILARRVETSRLLLPVLQVGDALVEAHRRHLVHRDIKPLNILLDEQGDAKLADFDLVSALDTTGGTHTGALGTFLYAAPECLERPQDATPRADVFSLGMTAIFCLSGQELSMSAFQNRGALLAKLDCSAAVRDVLTRASLWEPDGRFADAAAMVDALRGALRVEEAAARAREEAAARACEEAAARARDEAAAKARDEAAAKARDEAAAKARDEAAAKARDEAAARARDEAAAKARDEAAARARDEAAARARDEAAARARDEAAARARDEAAARARDEAAARVRDEAAAKAASFDLPETRVLYPSRLKMVLFLLMTLTFTAGGIWAVHDHAGSWAWPSTFFFGLGSAVFVIQMFPGAAYLRLTHEGFEMCSLFRAGRFKWTDVEAFRPATIGRNPMVVFNFSSTYKRNPNARLVARSLAGVEAGLPDTYGLGAKKLAKLLNEWRQRSIGAPGN